MAAIPGVPPVAELGTPPPAIFDLVKADLDERDRIGAAEHGGRPLMAHICSCGHALTRHYVTAPGSHAVPPSGCEDCTCCDYLAGRDWLREAYEEALDLTVYLRGALAEREVKA